MTAINNLQQNVTSNTRSSVVTNPIGAAAGMAWEIMQLLTGTYIFNVLYLLGVPAVAVVGIVVVYVILLMRAIVGYIRGI